ncbi:MAG: T9SS type A sorting domain-containing protein [Bacteroidota bacterium]|jgi:hypothetical protein
MNKSLLLFFALLLCCAIPLFGQIPNASFENWTSGSPDNWITTNSPPVYINITKSTVAHAGSSAVRGDVVALTGTSIVMPPFLQSGANGSGFTYNQRPAAFNGWYQFSPATSSGDQFIVNVILFKGLSRGTPIGIASALITASSSAYKQFSLPFIYISGDLPDTCVIQFQIAGTTGQPHLGSYFIVDDLSFGSLGTAVENTSVANAFGLDQNYPNPFNPSTAISYQLSAKSFVSLRVFNILGAEVATLVEGQKEAGRHTMSWNASSLPSGMYLYQLTATSEKGEVYKDTKRAVLLK